MNQIERNPVNSTTRLLPLLVAVFAAVLVMNAYGAAPGITGTTFNLTAQDAAITQPDGAAVYSWGYGCSSAPAGFAPTMTNQNCPSMQIPGPTLIVNEGATVTIKLTNNLPNAAGNTSILFPGFNVTATGGVQGLLTQEAAPGGTVTYTFTASSPGTHSYYSGTQGDLQIEMGLFGAVIVLPANPPGVCANGPTHLTNLYGKTDYGTANGLPGFPEQDFRLSTAAFDNASTCYDREYLFQFSEMDPRIHRQAQQQVAALTGCSAGKAGCSLNVATEPYHPAYFMINGRSMPDDMDGNYVDQYPHQPYNGDPHLHPGELVLLRIIGQGRWQHPFHEHANHVRILARDGNLLLSPKGALAGPALFTTTTTPGQTMDGIFTYTAKGLNWDMYGHNPASTDPNGSHTCSPDANGYYTVYDVANLALNYFEWCADHNKPLQAAPFGDVAGSGPVTLPDPNILTNGAWYGGSPYLGPDATVRATSTSGTTPPAGTVVNPPSTEAGFAFMWHSHNEREITTNNMFPGGMLMMMLVDSREFAIDETK